MASQWNTETMEQATKGLYYIPVTDLGKDQFNIGDAEEIWKKYPDVLFHTGSRIVGLKDDIVRAFQEQFIDDEDIDKMMTEMITLQSHDTTFSGNYQEELQNWKNMVVDANVKSEGRKMTDVITIANGKAPITSETAKAIAPAKKSPGTPGKGRGRTVTGLQERVNKAINDGKYLVVSKMKENGAGTTFADPPGARARNYYNDNEELPVSSNDLEHFLMAVNLLENGNELYADDVERAEEFFSTEKKTTPKTTPKTTAKTATVKEEKEPAPRPAVIPGQIVPVTSRK